jgi:hypothetical protein
VLSVPPQPLTDEDLDDLESVIHLAFRTLRRIAARRESAEPEYAI